MFFLISLWVSLSPLVLADAQGLAPSCRSIFKISYGFDPRFAHSKKYDVEVKDSAPVKNQCRSGHCHLYTWMAELENRHGIDISEAYLDMAYLRKAAHQAVLHGTARLQQSGNAVDTRAIILELGIVPKSAWTGRTDFIEYPFYNQLSLTVENILAKNALFRRQTNDKIKHAEYNRFALSQIDSLIDGYAGRTPDHFMYKGKTYTPQMFAQMFFPELALPLVRVDFSPNISSVRNTGTEQNTRVFAAPLSKMEALGRALIDSGRPFYLSYVSNAAFIDRHRGIMAIKAFNYPPMAYPLSLSQKLDLNLSKVGHAALVVGYELDPATGYVRKWKIKNSFGEEAGEGGYYHMYRDYFVKFVNYLAFVDDGKVRTHFPATTASIEN